MNDDPVNSSHAPTPGPLAALEGGGEMGRRIRDFDWSATPLGAVERWPQSLLSALSICLNSNFPIAIYWGSDLVLLYNDEWSPIPGEKHPWALGRPAREAWPEIWHIIEPLFGQVMMTGEATRSRDQLLPMHRHGFTEECYFDYTFSPIRGEDGKVEGVFNAVLETTTRVIGERRLRTLRELGAWKTGDARTAEEACETVAHILAENPNDLPFTLLYLLGDGNRVTLAGMTGLARGSQASPDVIDLDSPDAPWPFRHVSDSGAAVEVNNLPGRFGPLPGGGWPESTQQAVVLPVPKSGQTQPAGFVVAGISPRLALNDDYRGFLDLLAGHVAAAVASARAYEEERRRAEALAELDKAKTAFFSNVSHEFRTPLTLMLGPVEDMLAKPAEQVLANNRELLTVVHRNGLRLQRLVNSLLDFSRIEAGRVRATYEPTDLAELTADLASNFRSACEKAELRLRVDCRPLSEPVFVDRHMYEKIVLNLLSNAFKFTLEGEIAVSLRPAEQQVQLQVSDTGIGIPSDEMPKLFERFHRVQNANGRTHEGSGIGLALVQELVKLHGGLITAKSETGKGTTFTVTIPLGSGHLPPGQVRCSPAAPISMAGATAFVQEALLWLPQDNTGSEYQLVQDDVNPLHSGMEETGDRPRILVADDNADMRGYVARLLAGHFDVEAVSDGEAALEAMRRNRPDLILSDVMMPRLDGFGLLRRLRSDPVTAAIPFILLSARAGEESRVEGVEAGADDYLVKPFSGRELLARVMAQVQLARLRRQAAEALRQSEEHLRAVVETTPACIKVVAADGTLLSMNSAGLKMVEALRPEDVQGRCVYDVIRPEYREAFQLFNEQVCRGRSGTLEFEIEGLQGTRRRMETHAVPLRGPDGSVRQLAITHDITERKRAESLRAGQQAVLEMIATGKPLEDVLPAVCRLIEEQESGLLCSILLTDDAGLHTGKGIGPSLPTEFVKALEGIKIAPPHTGSCCKALDCGQEVLVADIENDSRWSPQWRDLNLSHGLRSCRSIPICGSDGTVLASVAVFRRESGDPGPANKELLGIATHLAGVAIERRRAEERERALLVTSVTANAQFRALFEQGAIFAGIMHVDGTLIEANRLSLEACGYAREQVIGKPFWDCPWWNQSPKLVQRIKDATAQAASGEMFRDEMSYFASGGRERAVDFILLPIKDESGKVLFLAPTGTDITERKQAENERERFFEVGADLLVIAGSDGYFKRVSPTCERTLGWSTDEMMSRPWADFLHPDDRTPTLDLDKQVKQGREVLSFENRYIHKDGSYRWLNWRAKPFPSEGLIFAGAIDITERKQAEEALRASEQRFRQLADAMAQIVWTARPNGEIDYLNRRWTEFTGLPDDIGNQGWSHILHREDAPYARERWAASLQTGEPFEMEVRLLDHREQSYRWHLIRTVAVADKDGSVVRWFGTSTDIHQQKRAEETSRYLSEASATLAGVVDFESTLQKVVNLAVPYFADWSAVDVSDGNGRLRRLAVAHKERAKIDLVHELMREYPPDPRSPGGAYSVYRTSKPEFIAEIADEMLVARAKDERHLSLIRSLGLKSYICVPLVVSGQTLGVLTFATAESGRRYNTADLSLATDLVQRAAVAIENTQLYQALKDADRRKDEFLATLAHELRNPLAPLRNGLQVLRLAGTNGEMADQARTMMERQLSQMVHLIDDLLDLSRISRGKIELRKERVELAKIVQQAVETSRPAIEAAGHEFLIDLPSSPIYVDADVTRLAQVFSNLLNNAAKYTESGGRVRLNVQRQGTEAVVSVRDTGIGIPAHMLPHVFEMFTQVDRNLERSQGGLGIGLSIVKRLVEMHGGSVIAESDGHGMGSEFCVRLPVVLSVVLSQNDEAEPQRSSSRRRVLVVDDNRDAAMSLAMMLKLMGNEVKTAHDGSEALHVAAAYRPDLILLDIGMPKMNGYDTARHIRQQQWGKSIVLVALTGWGQDEDRRKSQDAGFNSHMTKPIEPATLEMLLASVKAETG